MIGKARACGSNPGLGKCFSIKALLILSLALMLSGCIAPSSREAVHLTENNGRMFLLIQERDLENNPAFSIATSPSAPWQEWSSPHKYMGEVAGAFARGKGFWVVFNSGSISQFSYDEKGFASEDISVSRQKLHIARGNESQVYGLALADGNFQLYKLNESAWEICGKPLTTSGRINAADLMLIEGKVYALFSQVAPNNDCTLHAAMLEKDAWKLLPDLKSDRNWVAWEQEGSLRLAYPEDQRLGEKSGVGLHTVEWNGQAWASVTMLGKPWLPRTNAACLLAVDGQLAGAFLQDDNVRFACGQAKPTPVIGEGEIVVKASEKADSNLLIFVDFFLMAIAIIISIQLSLQLVKRARQMPDKESLAMLRQTIGQYPGVSLAGPASMAERGGALIIDNLLMLPAFFGYIFASGMPLEDMLRDSSQIANLTPAVMAYEVSFMVYAILCEIKWGRTLGKRVFNLRVRHIQGGNAGAPRIVLRNLLRMVDMIPLPLGTFVIPCFPAFLSMILSKVNQRFGDRLAQTIVVRKMPVASRELVLGSASPRRHVLLASLGLKFTVVEANVDETISTTLPLPMAVQEVAKRKAEAAAKKCAPESLIISADTIVVFNGALLGKPRDRDHAREMLSQLAGHKHEVYTGVAMLDLATGKGASGCAISEVDFRPMTKEEIDAYVESGESDGKAGAYGIQGSASNFTRNLRGSFTNVVGLPLELVSAMLSEMEG